MIGIFILRVLAASLIAFCTLMSAEYRTSTQAAPPANVSCNTRGATGAVGDLRMLAWLDTRARDV